MGTTAPSSDSRLPVPPLPTTSSLTPTPIQISSASQIMISTGSDMLNRLFPGIAFLVAAYIIHYGIRLQDEVDHTL